MYLHVQEQSKRHSERGDSVYVTYVFGLGKVSKLLGPRGFLERSQVQGESSGPRSPGGKGRRTRVRYHVTSSEQTPALRRPC